MTGERTSIRARMAQGDDDFWAVRRLLVETGDAIPANKLYASIGFTEIHHGVCWRKIL